MKVHISRELKSSKIDHLFVLLAEGKHDADLPDTIQKAIRESKFEGRSDEVLTLLVGQPRKVTLIGLGKAEAITHRNARVAITAAGRTAKKHRDAKIALMFPYTFPRMSEDETALAVADALAQSDYKYDPYITVKKDAKKIAIDATLIAPKADVKRLDPLSRAIAEAVHTVRDLGNAPSNVITPSRLAERAAEVCKSVGVKCTIYGRREVERMKMGGLIAVNRGSVEDPRFVVMEYVPKKA